MDDKINLAEKFAQLPDAYQPAIVGYMNDYKLVVVKTQGEFVWHKHDETDELFLIVKGRLTIQFRDRDVVLEPGELFVVPRGVEHCPKADEETHVLLIEPRETRQHRRRRRRADGRSRSRSRVQRAAGRRRPHVQAQQLALDLAAPLDREPHEAPDLVRARDADLDLRVALEIALLEQLRDVDRLDAVGRGDGLLA